MPVVVQFRTPAGVFTQKHDDCEGFSLYQGTCVLYQKPCVSFDEEQPALAAYSNVEAVVRVPRIIAQEVTVAAPTDSSEEAAASAG